MIAPGLIGITEAARRANVPVRTMRHRMCQLDRAARSAGMSPILVRTGSSKRSPWAIREAALIQLSGRDSSIPGAGIDFEAALSRLDDIERKLTALRDEFRREKKKNEQRWDLQEQINEKSMELAGDIAKLRSIR